MVLPTTKRKAELKSPASMLYYAPPKVGKTTIVSQLDNCLLIELEPNGAKFVDTMEVEANKPSEFNDILDSIEKANKEKGGFVYDYIAVDTITVLDEWSEITGTYRYMQKPQGQKLNRVGGQKGGKMIPHTNKAFETVHEIPNGYGYKHSRDEMVDWFYRLLTLAPHIILIAHVKDTLIESTKTGDTVSSKDINLTGKVKSIFCSKVDAVALLKHKENKGYLCFNNDNNTVAGGRCPHLEGEILISEKLEDKSIKTYWENIYIK